MFAVLIAISFVFAVMLEVFEAMFAVLVAISFVFAVILAVLAKTVELSAVMLEVLVETVVGKVAIVAELTPPTLLTTGAVAVPPKSFVNCNIPFVEASASGVIVLLAIKDAFTKAVVAICVLTSPVVGVGAVGVPVNEGDAIVALSAILFVFVVTLASIDVILKVLLAISFVLAVILAVLVAILLVFVVTLEFNEVILDVFDIIFAVLVAILFAFAVILAVFAAILLVLDVTLVFNAVILDVFAEMFEVFVEILAVFEAISFVFVVMLDVIEAILVGNVAIVAELTPPTVLTVGASAVPPKSLAN